MHMTPVLHNSSEGMFLCLPEELYILSAFSVRHVHSDKKSVRMTYYDKDRER